MDRRAVLQLLSTAGIVSVAGIAGADVSNGPFSKSNANDLLLRPQDFGAKVDGTTLDSPAINAAIDLLMAKAAGWSI